MCLPGPGFTSDLGITFELQLTTLRDPRSNEPLQHYVKVDESFHKLVRDKANAMRVGTILSLRRRATEPLVYGPDLINALPKRALDESGIFAIVMEYIDRHPDGDNPDPVTGQHFRTLLFANNIGAGLMWVSGWKKWFVYAFHLDS